MKKFAWIGLIMGLMLTVISLVIPMHMMNNASVSMIGGAGWPTYQFFMGCAMDGLFVFVLTLGVVMMITALVCLIFRGTITVHCSIPTTLVSLGLSAVGALGLFCAFTWYSIASFHEMSRYPIRYPVSIVLGLGCVAAFVGLIVGYIRLRSRRPSIKGVLLDVVTVCLYATVFLCLFDWIDGVLR